MAKKERSVYVTEITLYHQGRFMLWEDQNKEPRIYKKDAREFFKWVSVHYGPYSWYWVTAEMRLAYEYGSDLGPGIDLNKVIAGNELGEDGRELSLEEIFDTFIEGKTADEGSIVFETIEHERTIPEVIKTKGNGAEERIQVAIDRIRQSWKEGWESLRLKYLFEQS